MFTGLEAGRLPMAATLAKPNLLQNGYVSFIRPSRGVACRRRSLPFKGHRRQPVRTAAAEVDEPVPAGQPQRQARVVTVNLEAVKAGDEFTGTVVSVETYGAFVNFGAKSDGLVHISQLSDGFVKSVADKVRVNDTVKVRVLSVDAAQSRVALTMKGMQQLGAPEGDEPEDGYNEEPELEALEEEDMVDFAEDGIGFTVEDDGEAIGEFDEFEYEPVEATGNVEAILHVNDYVEGQVVGVEPFGVFVEFAVAGKKYQGLLHFSEMKVPAALAEAEEQEGEALEGEEEAEAPATVEASGAEEGEYMGEEYVDIGEVNDPSQYYKPGDRVQCFVLSVENEQKIELTQFLEDEEEDEADALLDELDPDGAEIQEVEYYDDDEEEEGAEPATLDVSSGTLDHATLTGQMHFDQIGTSVQTTMGGFILDKQGNFISPRMFPDRTSPGLIDPVALWTPSALDYEDDDGEESELIDYWAVDTKVPKNVLKKLGYKFEKTESGESEVVPRPGKAEAGEEREMSEEELYDLVNMVDDDDIEALVNDLLEDDVEEQELPVLAFRRPRVMAVSVENSKPAISASSVQQLRKATGAGMMDCKKALTECEGDFDKAQEWLRKKGLSGADKKAGRLAAEGVVARYIHPGSRLGVLLEINCETDFVAASDDFQKLVGEVGMVIASTDCVCVSEDEVPPELLAKEREVEMGKEDIKSKPEAIRAKIVDGRIEKIKKSLALMNQDSLRDPSKNITEVVKETIAKVGENIQIRRFVKYRLGEGLEKKSNDFAAEVAAQTQVKEAAPKKEEKKVEEKAAPAAPAIQVSAKVVKELRDKTGAGMMDCKKALAEVEGDMEKATEWLRKKGLASADKKAGRLAAEGVVAAYIHPGSRLGVLLEVNCETDFVAASEKFLQLVNGLAMQIAASQNVQYVTAEDIPAAVFEREKEIEMGREDLKNKPEAIRAKIAEGRVKKIAADMALMEQSYLMDPSKTVTEAIKEAIAAIGEKISVRRFVKFGLGEGLEKKSNDFAAEVAAATSKS